MTVFLSSPFDLTPRTLIVGVVEAMNSVGYSIPSDPNSSGAEVKSLPA